MSQQSSENSFERYARARQIDLGSSIADKKKIFLDMRFWILLRDADQDLDQNPSLRKLLHFLRKGVREGKWICPISASIFMELMRQSFTPTRRLATARLIDELSLGICSIAPQLLTGTEIAHLLLTLGSQTTLHPVQELIWTKVSCILGITYPLFSELDEKAALTIQKAFFDKMWECSLLEMVETLSDEVTSPDGFKRLSEETNASNPLHADELKSFEGAYDIELRGGIEACADVTADILEDFARKAGAEKLCDTRDKRLNAAKNILYHAMKTSLGRDTVRTIHSAAAIHAAVRWNKQRKVKRNDFFDFEHATVALGYCDLFLTEAGLRTLVTANNLGLDQLYNCPVASDPEEALNRVIALRKKLSAETRSASRRSGRK